MATKTKALLPGPAAPVLLDVQQQVVRFKLPAGKTLARLETLTASMSYAPLLQQFPDATSANGIGSVPVGPDVAALSFRVAATSTTGPGQVLHVAVDKAPVAGAAAVVPYSNPHVFMTSDRTPVLPGRPFQLIGHFSAGLTAAVRLSNGTIVQCPCIQAERIEKKGDYLVPAGTPLDRYTVLATDGATAAPEQLVLNQARGIRFDFPKTVAGARIRAIGRNLVLDGATPQAWFQAVGTTTRVEAIIDRAASTPEVSYFTQPALPVNTTYQVIWRNGLGGAAGETIFEQTLECLPVVATTLPVEPRVAALHPKLARVVSVDNTAISPTPPSDGTNSTQQWNSFIYQMYATGGGVINGEGRTYRANGSLNFNNDPDVFCINFFQGVYLYNCHIDYGYGTPQNGQGYGFMLSVDQCGLINVSAKNHNELGGYQGNFLAGGENHRQLFVNVTAEITGEPFKFQSLTNLYVKNLNITSRYSPNVQPLGPALFLDCTHPLLDTVTTVHEVGYCAVQNGSDATLINIKATRDATINNLPTPIHEDTRLWSWNNVPRYCEIQEDVSLESETINGPATDTNDSERLLNEGLGPMEYRDDVEYGRVSSATPTVLTDTSAHFGTRSPVSAAAVLVITAGTGMGQWRYVTASTATTLTVPQPWLVTPDATSVYTLTNWTAIDFTITGLRVRNNRVGIVLYCASALNGVIRGVDLENANSVTLQPYQKVYSGGDQPRKNGSQITPMWSIDIIEDVSRDTGNLYPGVPAWQGVKAVVSETIPLGPLAMNILLRRDQVLAKPGWTPDVTRNPQGSIINAPYFDFLQRCGFNFTSDSQFTSVGGAYHDGDNKGVPLIFGVLVDQCTAAFCDSQYTVDNTAAGVTIYDPQGYDNKGVIADLAQGGALKASVATNVVRVPAS